jgi:hypothetical protein
MRHNQSIYEKVFPAVYGLALDVALFEGSQREVGKLAKSRGQTPLRRAINERLCDSIGFLKDYLITGFYIKCSLR